MKVKTKFGIGVGVIVVSLSALAWMGAKESQTYYHTISELSTLNSAAMHQRIRVGGDVAAGSIQHMPGRVDFVLKEEGKTLPVSYVGADPLPDTFKDGAQCSGRRHTPCPTGALLPSRCRPSARRSMKRRPGRGLRHPGAAAA